MLLDQSRFEMAGRRLCILAVLAVFFQSGLLASVRTRRSIGQFGDMIRLTTRMEALLFNNYGNHCGSGNSANRPVVDAIDRCCWQHDLCYENLPKGPCSSAFFGPYFTSYTWKTGIDSDRVIECGDNDNDCKLATCNCDRTAALCFARHSANYNPVNKRRSIWDWLI